MIRLISTSLALVASSSQADAVTNEVASSLFTGNYLLQVVGSLFLVIFVLLGVMVLLKRFNTLGASTGGYIQVLASTPLGQRERAVLLKVGNDQILVGVASGNVTALHHLSEPVAPIDSETPLSFKEVWSFASNKQGGKR